MIIGKRVDWYWPIPTRFNLQNFNSSQILGAWSSWYDISFAKLEYLDLEKVRLPVPPAFFVLLRILFRIIINVTLDPFKLLLWRIIMHRLDV